MTQGEAVPVDAVTASPTDGVHVIWTPRQRDLVLAFRMRRRRAPTRRLVAVAGRVAFAVALLYGIWMEWCAGIIDAVVGFTVVLVIGEVVLLWRERLVVWFVWRGSPARQATQEAWLGPWGIQVAGGFGEAGLPWGAVAHLTLTPDVLVVEHAGLHGHPLWAVPRAAIGKQVPRLEQVLAGRVELERRS